MLPRLLFIALLLLGLVNVSWCEQAQNDDQGADAAEDENAADGADAADGAETSDGSNSIKYWTEYAILPKRCIVYDDVDVIVFSVFEHGYKQCSDEPMGTYVTDVPTFVYAYMQQKLQNQQDLGNDDYASPESVQYTACTRRVVNNVEYFVQLGCSDETSQALALNIYKDNTCTQRDTEHGSDDANADISALQLPFKKCQACVNWVDYSDDKVDDQFYENHQTQAPLCSTTWENKQSCDRKCQKTGLERQSKEGWNTSDEILLGILAVFGVGMLIAILRKRQQMSNKDALLEQAAMSAAGMQQAHVIGIFVLVVIVITVFALLNLKNLTWALLLVVNTVLFGYLMKLTIDSGVSTGEAVIGPDGTIIRRGDSDDSSLESSQANANIGGYMIPQIT